MKIISGGQTGADQAGLFAAINNDIETSGFAPANYMTTKGPDDNLKTLFGLKEIKGGYKKRTYLNVQFSDCTLRFAYDFNSPGEICTKKAIEHYNQSYQDIDLNYPITPLRVDEIAQWVMEHKFYVINIAGNTERKLSVFKPVFCFVDMLIKKLKQERYI